MIYANDRDPSHSASYAAFGHLGTTATVDPTIPREERGHPIRHVLTNSIPSSQCIVCHVHPGTNVVNAYYGTMWWDNETDGKVVLPGQGHVAFGVRDRRDRAAQPRGLRHAGSVGRPTLSGAGDLAQSEADAHAGQRLQRPRLDLPQRVLAQREGQPARRRGPADRLRQPQEVRGGRAPQGHPPREGDALRRLPLPRRQSRRRQSLRRDASRDQGPLRRLPRRLRPARDPDPLRRDRPDEARDAVRTEVPEAPRQGPAAVGARRQRQVGGRPDGRYDHAGQRALQRALAPGEDDAGRRRDLGIARRPVQAGAREQQGRVPDLPHGVGHVVLRLPSADGGQPQEAQPPLRGYRLAQLHAVQLPDPARRRLHAGP